MEIKYIQYRRQNPWIVCWKSSWTGKRHRVGFPSEPAAQAFSQALSDIELQEKRIMAQRRKRVRSKCIKITVEELFSRYFSLGLTNKTTIKQSQYHAAHIIKLFGKRQVSLLSCDDIINFIEIQKLRNLNQSTINRRISILRSAVNWSVKYGILPKSPLSDLRLPLARSRRTAPPTPRETKLIYDSAAPHLQRIIAIGAFCGPRIGPSELFQLRWADVDLEAGVIRMPSADKGAMEKVREIPIRQSLSPLLREWRDTDLATGISFVISWQGKPIRSVNRAWHTAVRNAGIFRRITPYSLRHSFATYSIEGGAKLKAVAKLMGHKDETMLLRTYQHVLGEQEIEAVEAVPDMLNLGKARLKRQKRRIPNLGRGSSGHAASGSGSDHGNFIFPPPHLLHVLSFWISPAG